jgi:hypothetical protein
MWRSVVIAGLTLVVGAAPAPTILDDVVIEAKDGRVEIRHPTFQGSGARVTMDQKKGWLVLHGTATAPATVKVLKDQDAPKTFRGMKIVLSLKDGSIESVQGK